MSDRDQRFQDTDVPPPAAQAIPLPTTPLSSGEMPISAPSPKEKTFTRMHNKLNRMHLFSAFSENPQNITVQGQEPDEEILLFLRKSQWLNSFWGVVTAGLILLPLVLYLLRDLYSAFIPPLRFILVGIPFYYLLVATYAFLHFISWYYNAALVTNKRIIDIDFHQLVMKDVAETNLALVQDVSYNQDGVLPNMFGYGHVLVQTAGTLDNFDFHHLPQPTRVVAVIQQLISRNRPTQPFYER